MPPPAARPTCRKRAARRRQMREPWRVLVKQRALVVAVRTVAARREDDRLAGEL